MAYSFELAVISQRKRRMKRRSMGSTKRDLCRSQEPSVAMPFDIMMEILTRLPAKSLMRFKSVSKLWSSLICSKYFTSRFFRAATSSSSAPCRLYMCLHFSDSSNFRSVVLSASPSFDESCVNISSIRGDQDLTVPAALRGYHVCHVFHGLMCFVDGLRAQIYNSTTRQLVVLPDIQGSKIIPGGLKDKKIMYYIGHDPVRDQYKVVCVVATKGSYSVGEAITFMSEHWVYSLGGDGSSRWRNVPCQSSHLPLTQVVAINGCMHYLAWVGFDDCVLVSFDMSSEEISMLQGPKDCHLTPIEISLIEYGGNRAILDYFYLRIEGKMKLWVMEDAKKNRWSSKTLVLHSSQFHMVNSKSDLSVIGTTRNGEVIFTPQGTEKSALFYIFLYDIQKNHMRKVKIKKTPNRHLTECCDVFGLDLDATENLVYLKT